MIDLWPQPEVAPGEYALLRFSRRAMATTFEIALPYGTPNAIAAAEDALDLVDSLEDQLTIYRDHSEVSALNTRAAQSTVAVEPRLFELLQQCAVITNQTEGAFDVAIGALVKCWGFFRREPRVPTPAERKAVMQKVGMRHVILESASGTVKFRRPGVEINLGSIGKGYALDRVAERLRDCWNIRSALIHGGGSSVYGLGTPPDDSSGWPVAIRHPWSTHKTLGMVRLKNSGLGTSAATFQHLDYNGRKLGHVLDPRSGWPAEGVASATVIAPRCAEADAISTACFILGIEKSRQYLRSRTYLGSVLLSDQIDALPSTVNLGSREYSPPTFRETYLNDLLFPD